MKKVLGVILLSCIACSRVPDAVEETEVLAPTAVTSADDNLIVLDHSLAQHHLSIIRNKDTKPSEFRASIKKIAELLVVTATKNLPTADVAVETPVAKTICRRIDPRRKIFVVPILRAGLGISCVAEDMIPDANIQLLGMYRDEKTHNPVWYYNKLPATFSDTSNITVFICDPMLATGGSAYETIKLYLGKGILEKNITFLSVISAPEGVKRLREAFPEIRIITASLDQKLNERAYIVPGLGDAGDRFFNFTAK
ncbi:MAG: uracil phosphoribosyltransferase [Holosporaceae bacterium]|jgi:uracil phosphoribosyltransferase|nr:uracil phosphoribosyltransferase [Holosporaceae bacterium]